MLAPGRNRSPVWIPSADNLARRVPVNGEPSSAIGSLLVFMAGTIWLSKATTAETRNASGTASRGSGLPVVGLSGITSRCSVPPGRKCSRPASCWSIMACPAALGLNIRPCKILTRSAETPRARPGLEKVSTTVCGRPWRAGSAVLYTEAVDVDATCGSRASAASYLVSLGPLRTLTWAALAQRSSRG